jgi:phospholipase C
MPPGGLEAVEHVIVLMQENRSFDHYFGTLRGVRGYGDSHPLVQPNGRSVFHQATNDGEVLPFSLREAAQREGRAGTDIQYLGGLPHSWPDSSTAWGHGWLDQWIPAKTAATMTYYERQDIPLQYELADTFTICDAYHCSINGSTNPNRNYLWTGTTGYEPGTNNRAVTNAAYKYDHPGYDWTTYPERLQSAGVSWQIYQEWDNFTDNAVEYFKPFKAIGRKILAAVDGGYRTTEEFYYSLFGKSSAEQQRLLGQLEAGRARLTEYERRLFDRAMYRSKPETLVERLKADVSTGKLPRVSWLVPSAADSEHPSASTPVGSANLIYEVLDAVASDPQTWSKTVLFINFDENDGFFDHVPPPVAPRSNDDEWYADRPMGLGPRVPMLIVSPWTIGGYVSSEVADHTSIIRFLERWTTVGEPNISPWRRQVCGDLTSAFDFNAAGAQPNVNRPGPVPAKVSRWRPTPPSDQRMPVQEPGRRPTRPIPYEPAVSTRLDGNGTLILHFTNTGTRSAHFALYPYENELPQPTHLDVTDRHQLAVPVPGDRYQLAVQGPNQFWYTLEGTAAGAAARIGVGARHTPAGTRLNLVLDNEGTRTVTLTLTALAHSTASSRIRLRGRQQRVIPWDTPEGWYDLEVTTEDDRTFRRRLTGRTANNRPGFTA